ncbi:1-(5-phosphoribosyl)-5-[(5-phosphoribosylamino)methylideneamino] imidazole-4-carboxamide isomerase [Thermodesulfitimonas autotrophica]|uniref:1-(5-phosphoribosyl)-5-[(5-phosphoribosylamino)methylideneamino] imidazole-4-carboxamide isomerase n=1 Tax=Thermodesulfitimonas autotrophica TaxID=1894989 RepID=A0A3N5AQB7_9THEO|nr:1-(5-phosphoribosyl)-5-[(5-phosphoribosylamino)methylideneamino]imidazole-4-carboxamide isomerase [Thermodesulfitimonas autotrophica]RPF47074.1 1-(5-phosphoribosyl)-5-[(5-phosphoribosylamino)methylideneamino] imidazole-4-carboxamide isomerase [Thermodesulfitimonas autotrophica]
MLVIPAIDLRGGRCVRLVEGRPDKETVYSGDPVTVARRWEAAGAKMLHVVDLDGAFAGRPAHLPLIREIVAAVAIPVQVGGGIRDRAAVEAALACGVARVILGTAAVTDTSLLRELVRDFGARVLASVDCRDGVVAVRGWESLSGVEAAAFGRQLKECGVERVVFTDIARDGTLMGPNIAAVGDFARVTGLKVIASGGVSRVEDIRALRELEEAGVEAVIIGKALYDGRLSLAEAIAAAEGKEIVS